MMAFTVFDKVGDVCAALEEEDRRQLCYAVFMYGMYGEEVELPYLLEAVFISLKEDIDNSKEARQRGSRGGRPKKARQEPCAVAAVNVIPEPDGCGDAVPLVSEEVKPEVSETAKPQVSESTEPPVSEKGGKGESQTKPTQTKPSQTKGGRRFAPPSLAEVRGYASDFAAQKGLDPGGFDPERFVDYYAANGWRVGRNPMRDWRAAVRDWVRKDCGKAVADDDEYSRL